MEDPCASVGCGTRRQHGDEYYRLDAAIVVWTCSKWKGHSDSDDVI